jgi:hypothetical protein
MQGPARKTRAQQRVPAAQPTFDVRAVLAAIARPRLTGSPAAREITADIKARLEAYGYDVHDAVFQFSSWPGRFGVSVAGACLLVGSLAATVALVAAHPGVALVVLLTLFLVVGAIAALVKPAMSALRWGRVQGINLLAHKPGMRPRYYLMAHRDSKSQPLPLVFRGPALVAAAIAWLALTLMATAALFDPIWNRADLALALGACAALSGVILIFCWVNNRSPGALDNASGVTALLGVAAREAGNGDTAFIITDAEELGLAGAYAIAQQLPPSFGVINIDGLDDEGSFYVIERFGWPRKKGAAPHLAAALLNAADRLNLVARRRDVPLGLLLDHIPIVNAGTPALTLMHGRLASLRRVHRPADNLDHLNGQGIERAIDLLEEALRQLRQQQP